ncbi:MAG TPA: septum formation initiator family protein [Candidatus Paceibacterota bacterium]|nr:septum formation initiator family protein [Verrucomicrobiota bacterium]HRY48467.1 septum formation initiator family protein [Candidatus Paceibacterota bacterium]HRZ99655.1 septum formation initiator family protein [Candidatus Paceibacterota bacterium]
MSPNRKRNENGVRYGALIKSLLLCMMIGGAGVGYVWQKQQVHALGKQKKQAEMQLDEYRRQNDRLAQKLSLMQSPSYLEQQAKQLNLGLVPPTPDQVLRLVEHSTDDWKTAPLAMGSNQSSQRVVTR